MKLAKCLCVALALFGNVHLKAKETISSNWTGCSSSREYITTLNYLRSNKAEIRLGDNDRQNVAMEVSKGCSGAASRFIRVIDLLKQVELTNQTVLRLAIDLAKRTEAEVDTFLEVFKLSYLPSHLDLSISDSLQTALKYSTQYSGSIEQARKDLSRLIKFCLSGKDLNLPRGECLNFSMRLTDIGEKSTFGVSEVFVNGFSFLTESKNGPMVPTFRAMQLLEDLIQIGPSAVDNFIDGYEYAIKEEGLNLPRDQALDFAFKMANHTRLEEAASKNKKLN